MLDPNKIYKVDITKVKTFEDVAKIISSLDIKFIGFVAEDIGIGYLMDEKSGMTQEEFKTFLDVQSQKTHDTIEKNKDADETIHDSEGPELPI